METIHSYRHVIPKETIKHFETAVRSVLHKKDFRKLGFIGLMIDWEKSEHHDIDLIIFPAQKAKVGEAMIQLIDFYNTVEKELQKENERYYLATCPKMAMQEYMYYIASIEEGAAGLIPVHSMFFTSYRDFRKISPKKFADKVEKGTDIYALHGNFEDIKKIPQLPQKKLEPYFFVLDFELNARIKTFPRHIIRTSTEHLFYYLKIKYRIPMKEKIPHNIKGIEKEFIVLMKRLDKETYAN
jgi:hypothetical protein